MATPVFFSLKLASEGQLKKLIVGNEFGHSVVVEGFLGNIKRVSDFEQTLVRIEFENGEISMDVSLQEFVELLKKVASTGTHDGE